MSARILVVDDKPNIRQLFAKILRELGTVVTADDGRLALALLEESRFDVVLSDIRMPELDGHALLAEVRRRANPPEVILMTAYATVESAVEALRHGAFDYLAKPFDPDEARAVVGRALEKRGMEPLIPSPARAAGTGEWQGLVGDSSQMRELFALLERVAPSVAPILLLGESGTGKELLARAVHGRSPRASKRFVALNCAAIPDNLMEAELFGYAKGAFTGANLARAGIFEESDGGTLFLDEIGEMRRELQAKLTRALEERAIRRIGESEERPVDVRVVSATHRDLPALVAQGAFREDLFYRLNTCIVRVPPLRERTGDLRLIVDHVLKQRAAGGKPFEVTPAAMEALAAHTWPGNVRELRSAIERAVLLADDGRIVRASLPPEIATLGGDGEPSPVDFSDLSYRDAIERLRVDGVRRYVEALLRRFQGNVAAAAEHADVERESFYRLCRKHGVSPNDYRSDREPPKSKP